MTEYGAAAIDLTKPSKEEERAALLAARARQGDYDNDLILEQLARNRAFLTDEGLEKLRNAFVIVVGCGGVGSHCVAALARSGVPKIRLIDFDQVTLSSLNRHAVATLADVGTPKVLCIRKRLEAITPWVHFDCRNELFSGPHADTLLEPLGGQPPTFIVDAIDNIDSKVALLHYCSFKGLPVISSMGAGAKSDPTRIFIGDISASTEDPLSKATRVKLRALGVKRGIPVVFSTEKPGAGKAGLLPLNEEEFAKGAIEELAVQEKFRVRIMPVLGSMPAIFGLAVANHIMLSISGYPIEYIGAKYRDKMYDGIHGALVGLEGRMVRAQGESPTGLRIPLTMEDVGFLVDEVFRSKSVLSGLTTRLVLTRWRKPPRHFVDRTVFGQVASRMRMNELVVMTKEEAKRHEEDVLLGELDPEVLYSAQATKLVHRRWSELAYLEQFR